VNVLRKHEKKESALIENMRVCYCDEKSGNVLVLHEIWMDFAKTTT
jgi:hypothetical protein